MRPFSKFPHSTSVIHPEFLTLCSYLPEGHIETRESFLRLLTGCSGQLLKKHYSASSRREQILSKSVLSIPLDILNHREISPVYIGKDTTEPIVIAVNSQWIVFHKPPHVHSHPLNYSDSLNCLSYLRAQGFGKDLQINQNQHERGLLYRLDYETSGVMVYCRNESLLIQCRDHFNQWAKTKTYLAIVHGRVEKEKELIHSLVPSQSKGSKMKAIAGTGANLHVSPLAYSNEGMTLLKVNLHQGLRHQIRAQLSAIGHPIVGDPLYSLPGLEKKSYSRLYLHALTYAFTPFEGSGQLFTSPYWQDFAELMGQEISVLL